MLSCCTKWHFNLGIMPLFLKYAIYGQLDCTHAPLTIVQHHYHFLRVCVGNAVNQGPKYNGHHVNEDCKISAFLKSAVIVMLWFVKHSISFAFATTAVCLCFYMCQVSNIRVWGHVTLPSDNIKLISYWDKLNLGNVIKMSILLVWI